MSKKISEWYGDNATVDWRVDAMYKHAVEHFQNPAFKSELRSIVNHQGGISVGALREHVIDGLKSVALQHFSPEEIKKRKSEICDVLGAKRMKSLIEQVTAKTFGKLSKEYLVLKGAELMISDSVFLNECASL